MKCIDRADQLSLFCSILRKTRKWTEKVMLSLINCGIFNSFRAYNILNTQGKMKYKQFLHLVVRDRITDNSHEGYLETETNVSSPFPGGTGRAPHKDPPKSLSGDMKQHEPMCIPASGKKKFPVTASRVVPPTEKGADLDTYVNFIWSLFTEENVLWSAIH